MRSPGQDAGAGAGCGVRGRMRKPGQDAGAGAGCGAPGRMREPGQDADSGAGCGSRGRIRYRVIRAPTGPSCGIGSSSCGIGNQGRGKLSLSSARRKANKSKTGWLAWESHLPHPAGLLNRRCDRVMMGCKPRGHGSYRQRPRSIRRIGPA